MNLGIANFEKKKPLIATCIQKNSWTNYLQPFTRGLFKNKLSKYSDILFEPNMLIFRLLFSTKGYQWNTSQYTTWESRSSLIKIFDMHSSALLFKSFILVSFSVFYFFRFFILLFKGIYPRSVCLIQQSGKIAIFWQQTRIWIRNV